MNFKNVQDQELLSSLKETVQNEKALTHQVLLYLREVENRKLHLEKGYSSLFVFCTEFLGYSEPEAQIRIQAMRLLKSVPVLEEKIKSGAMSLSVAANVQSHFRKEDIRRKEEGLKALSFTEKLEVVEKVQSLSVRESQKTLAAEFPEVALPKDRVTPLTSDKSKLEFIAGKSLVKKLGALQNKLAHKNPNNSLGELIEILADMALEKLETKTGDSKQVHKINTTPHGTRYVAGRGYLSKSLKQTVWSKSNSQCCYIDKATNKQCLSQYALEIDHILPVSLGGTDDPQNLRLLCRAHNQYLGKII